MENRPGPKKQHEYTCRCCGKPFETSKQRATHESNKRIQGKGPEKKRFRTSDSVATPSIAGSFFGAKDTNIQDLMFDIPSTKQQQLEDYRLNNIPTADELLNLAKSFRKTDLGPKSGNQQKISFIKGPTANKIQQSSTSKASTTDSVKEVLETTVGWKMAVKTYESDEFNDLPKLTEDFAKSFLLLGGNYGYQNTEFPVALSKVVEFISAQKIPTCLLPPYLNFFKCFNPTEQHNSSSLKGLLTLAKKINADMTWIAKLQKPISLLVESAWLETDQQITVASILCCQRAFFSADYFNVIEQVLKSPFTSKCLVNTLDNFFDFFSQQYDKYVDEDMMLAYAGLDNKYNINTLKKQLEELQREAKRPFSNIQLIPLLKLANTKNYQAIKMMVRTLPQDAIAEDMVALLEDIEMNFQEKELLIQEELQRQQLKKQKEDEEQKQKQAKEQMEKDQKQEEEKKKNELKIQEELKNKKEQEETQQQTLEFYHYLCTLNNKQIDDPALIRFVDQMKEIAAEINIVPRPEQLATMFLMLTSTHKRTLMQRPTGTGKSLMFGLMSRYIDDIRGEKTVVAVPNEVLAAIQQKRYAPWSSKDIDELYTNNSSSNYCTYSDVLTGNIPFGTMVFIDEVDSLFFSDAPIINTNRFLSAILLMNKYKLIGMTATFRGERGLNKMKAFLSDTVVINAGAAEPERKLQLDVFGKLKVDEVDLKVIEVAKQKQQELPVIIIFPSINKCEEMQQHFEHCIIFGKGRVFEQMNCLEELGKVSNAPWPVILTTAEASLGHDLVAVAYVIQITIPQQFAVFMQNAGRSNRIDPDAPLVGALITTAVVTDINSVKQGCEFEQQRQKLFREDYLQCLQYLECCCLVDASLPTFKSVLKLFRNSASAIEIYKALTKVLKFKVALEAAGLTQPCRNAAQVFPISKFISAVSRETAIVVDAKILRDKNINQAEKGFGMLVKRITRSKKCSKDSSEHSANSQYSSSNETQHFKQCKQAQHEIEVNSFVDELPIGKEEYQQMSDELTGHMINLEQNKQRDEKKGEDEQQFFKQFGPKELQLNPKVLKEKELEEARVVFTKHGFLVSELTRDNLCRTSTAMLFGKKGSKKRVEKATNKIEMESIKSRESTNSIFTVGSKLSNRAIVKEVHEEDWVITTRKDKGNNKFYCCKRCQKECRGYDRKTHKCNV